MAIPDPPKAGSPFCALWTGGWNPKTPKINNFFIPEITLRGGYTGKELLEEKKSFRKFNKSNAKQRNNANIATSNNQL